MQVYYPDFQEAGAEVIALVVAPIEVVEGWCKSAGVTYPMLADPEHRAAEAYGVYNLLGDGLAAPSLFVIDADGRILWHEIGPYPGGRVEATTILARLP